MKRIELDKADADFKYEVASKPGAENIKKCFSCGTCTGACPVFRVESEYNPRKIIRMILLGLREEVLSSKIIWLCSGCHACTAHCPQEVNFADVMTVLRDMAIAEGYASADILEGIDEITRSAQDFRKDCIDKLTGRAEISKKKIVEKVNEALKSV